MTTVTTLADIEQQLQARHVDIHTITTDLKALKVRENEHFTADGIDLFVKPKDEHPVRQLCTSISMGYGFYAANPGALNSTIFETRFRGIDKGTRQLRYRKTAEGNRLLSVLPVVHQGLSYVDTIKALTSVLPGDAAVRLSNAGQVDEDHRFSLRVTLPDAKIEVLKGDPLELGFCVDASEDGIGRYQIHTLLFQLICLNGAIATYNDLPLVDFNYRGIPSFALAHVLDAGIARFDQDLKAITDQVQLASQTIWTKDEAVAYVKSLETRRDVSLTFLRRLRKELDAKDVPTLTQWDVTSELTFQAQKLPYRQRSKHELAAGKLLGLQLSAIQREEPLLDEASLEAALTMH